MIRPITAEDSAAIIALTVETGLFQADEAVVLEKMLADYFDGKREEGHACVIDEEGKARGVAYYCPAAATEGTWYLLLIAVRPDSQGQGRGAALLRSVEDTLRASGQRLLLVETSALPSFERTRAFYAKCEYTEVARIRDYYKPGEDMIIFRKSLNEA